MNDYKVEIIDAFESIMIESRTFTRKIEALNYMSKAFDERDNIVVKMRTTPAAYTLNVTIKDSSGMARQTYINYPCEFEKAQNILTEVADKLINFTLTR